MDEVDWKIVDMLLKDARTPFSKIGEALGLGKDTIQKRVKNLHKDGTLGTPTIYFNAKKCGFEGIIDFFIKTAPGTDDISPIQEQLAKLPYLISSARTLGDYNIYASSFFRNFDDIRQITETVKNTPGVLTFEIAFYSKDTSSPIIMPFIEGKPEGSIVYKIRLKTLQKNK